jgi:hypothetical protein
MFGCVSTFDREKHTFIGGELGHYINRLAKESKRDFAVVRYEKLNVFCIIEFLSPLRDVFVDTMNLGHSLANFNREKKEELLRRVFKPVTCAETSRALEEADSDYHHERQDDNAEDWENEEREARGG